MSNMNVTNARNSQSQLMRAQNMKLAQNKAKFALSNTMKDGDLAATKTQVDFYNAKHNAQLKKYGLSTKRGLGQDKYLKLLVTQLKHQDPTNPVKNHEFAAQMAQFSALEQMTKLNGSMNKMLKSSNATANYNLLGKQIQWVDSSTKAKTVRSGVANAIDFVNGNPTLRVGFHRVAVKDIIKVTATSNKR